MRKEMLGAISAFALMTGAAFAQDTTTTTDPMQPAPSATMQDDSNVTAGAGAGGAETNEGATEAPTMGAVPTPDASTEAPTVGTAPAPDVSTEGGMAGATTALSAEEMMGKSVLGADGEEVGEVADVIIDPTSGEAQQVILSRGGILGLGEKQVAIDFGDLQPSADGEALESASLTADQVEQMPEFEYQDGTVSVNRPGDVGAVTE